MYSKDNRTTVQLIIVPKPPPPPGRPCVRVELCPALAKRGGSPQCLQLAAKHLPVLLTNCRETPLFNEAGERVSE